MEKKFHLYQTEFHFLANIFWLKFRLAFVR